MTYAASSDVAARLGKELSAEDKTLVETRLADVERMILRRAPDLADDIEAGTVDEEDVKQVEAEAVLRLVRNPDGYLQETDGNYSYMLNREIASGKLEILPHEWRMLGVRPGGMFSLVPSFGSS